MLYPCDYPLNVFKRLDMDKLLLVIPRMRDAVQIPREMMPRLKAGDALAAEFSQRLYLAVRSVHTLVKRRERRLRLSGGRGVRLREQPRIAEAAAQPV